MPNQHEIPYWHTLNTFDRAQVLAGKQPVIIKNLVKNWPLVVHACDSFDAVFEYLMKFDNKLLFDAIVVDASEKGRIFYNSDFESFNFEQMKGYLPQAIEIFKAVIERPFAPAFYIGSKPISEYFPGLEKENAIAFLHHSINPTIWLGTAAQVAIHNDHSENIACVVAGRRRFTLFPPETQKFLYIGSHKITPAGRPISHVNLNCPDFEKFPQFKKAMKYAQKAELEAGDAIYIPLNWWHGVESLGKFNVLVNYWWNGLPPAIKCEK